MHMLILIAIDFQFQLTGISDCENWKVRVLSDRYNYFTLEGIVAVGFS